jgi:enoyl-CoA hydratase
VDELLVTNSQGVCTITLNRASARNALTAGMRQGIAAAAEAADADAAVSVVVLTGVDPAFCAGVDLNEINSGQAHDAVPPRRAADGSVRRPRVSAGTALRAVQKPVIAAVNGPCYTGGLELALSCDIIIASDRASFADTHARFGLVPYWGMSALLPLRVGVGRARWMSLTSRVVGAEDALRTGLADEVIAHQDLGAHVAAVAADIVAAAPAAVMAAQRLYDMGTRFELDARLALEAEIAESFPFDRDDFDRRLAARRRPAG